jgi:hypothetical protein
MEGLPTSAYAVMIGLVAVALAIAMLIRLVSVIRSNRRSHAPRSKRRI